MTVPISQVLSLSALNALARSRGWPLCADGEGLFYLPETRAVCALWRSKAVDGHPPPRSEMSARLLKPYLRLILIHERVPAADGHRYRSRLMGESVAEMIGEASGKFYEEYLTPEMVRMWSAMAEAVFVHGGPVRFLVRADGFAKMKLAGEIFAAPMLTAEGRPDLLLSAGRFSEAWSWDELAAHWQHDMASSHGTAVWMS
ncbi:MAG: PAS domain-containing protein [Alphaproteobacteria bacterium]|nr:PAS domain-containing protein [Alphaproteobacteria bacterium]